MTHHSPSKTAVASAEGIDASVRPFRIEVPESALEDLRERLSRTRWPDELSGVGWNRGVPLGYLKELAEYWRTAYDWRRYETQLNGFPQYVTSIDGQKVHFLHVRSPELAALPLIMTHGWPGSIAEFMNIIGPLSNPRAHGGDPADAFHLILPSIPGFGFSGPTHEVGWNVQRIAAAWVELMRRLEYDRYGAQGGDWGSMISREVGVLDPEHVVGVHVNMLFTFPSSDPAEMAQLTDLEKQRLQGLNRYNSELSGYARIQGTRPQTLAYGLTDSPAGQLAWIVEKFKEWTDTAERPEEAVDRDQMLTNVMLYWLTATAGSSARIYYEAAKARRTPEPCKTPMGVAVFPRDIVSPIRRFAERSDNIVHWSEFDRGGHFAAMETPELLTSDVRKFFSRFR